MAGSETKRRQEELRKFIIEFMAAWKFYELQKIFAGLRPNKEIFAANTQKNLGIPYNAVDKYAISMGWGSSTTAREGEGAGKSKWANGQPPPRNKL